MPFRLVAATTLTLAAAPALVASEAAVRDLALDLEFLPAEISYTYRSPTAGAVTGDDAFDSAYGLALGGRYGLVWPGSRHGLLAGLQLTYGTYTYDPGDSDYITYGVRLTPGYALSLSDSWALYAEPIVEYGLAEFDFGDTDGFEGFTADGDYLWFGGQVRATYAITDNWLVNAHGGYISGTSELDAPAATSFEFDHEGLILGLGLTWRFSAAPATLE